MSAIDRQRTEQGSSDALLLATRVMFGAGRSEARWLLAFFLSLSLLSGEAIMPEGVRDAFGRSPFSDALDKIGEIVGRGFCWCERKLGLQPMNWPQNLS